MLRVSGIRVPIQKRNNIETAIIHKLRIEPAELISYRIFKESIDARRSDMIYFVYTVDVKLRDESVVSKKKGVKETPHLEYHPPEPGRNTLKHRPIIVGTGPCGLLAGLLLAELGYQPLLLERGSDVDHRAQQVENFWQTGMLNEQANVQFGEGGAGTFSDGKLTTNIKDKRCRKVLTTFVENGAPEDILYSAKPHVGTDKLRQVVKNIRQRIIELGGEVRFNAQVTDLIIKNEHVTAVVVNQTETVDTNAVILAIGHSARDTFTMLYEKGVTITPKAFSIGARIEHSQELIDKAQYGKFAGHPNLGAADYKLKHHLDKRSAYTFCMCPGGVVVAAASEPNSVVTNGMSFHDRAGRNANSAVLVGVGPKDFGSEHPLAGVDFQRKWEQKAFELGEQSFKAPAQLVGDFLKDQASQGAGGINPSYAPGVVFTDLSLCLPDYVVETMKTAIVAWDRKIRGFAHPEAVLTGVETRSSSPIRIVRGQETFESSFSGLYPAGEGAGYAGGIVSAGVDGIRVAEAIITRFAPPKGNEVK